MLSGCATSGEPPLQRALPPPPAWAQPVDVRDPRAGENPRAVAARERAGRVEANERIRQFGGWYGNVRTLYAR